MKRRPDSDLSQISKRIRLTFEAAREQFKEDIATGLKTAFGGALCPDERDSKCVAESPTAASGPNYYSPVRQVCDEVEAEANYGGDDMAEEIVTQDDLVPEDKNKKLGSKTSKPQARRLRQPKSKHRSKWAVRVAQWIGTYDTFLDVPEDLFDDVWSVRPRPNGYRCLLVRNTTDIIHIIGKGGQEFWTSRKDTHSSFQMYEILSRIPENTVIEGIWDGDLKWFFAFDLLIWHSMEMADCDFRARSFFLSSKWEEFGLDHKWGEHHGDQGDIRILLIMPVTVTPASLAMMHQIVQRCNMASDHDKDTFFSWKTFDILQHNSPDFLFLKYDGLVFNHHDGIYTPCINPFMLHWRHPDISIWAASEGTRTHFKGSLVFRVETSVFSTCGTALFVRVPFNVKADGTRCELVDCEAPTTFREKVSEGGDRGLIVRLSYQRLDLRNGASGETIIMITGAKLVSWKWTEDARAAWKWNGADSFSRLIFDIPLYNQKGQRVDTSSPTLERVLGGVKDTIMENSHVSN
eukprot:Protomagalhaensia_sp_Gyna_25__5404@NODE_6_length_9172_cov_212_725172_g5_i0_p2_GENE_NODE_6_length_9172_cov_212_725172_g5_i0NODE_6_length_9172_cov_212_725172_g5_i0_p2_ORF_typecomplete_len520_score59_70mRNA_cap_enzyme/PF01331_19/0_0015_NODE_6_length_9172_cov_212_725172_g5_i0221581